MPNSILKMAHLICMVTLKDKHLICILHWNTQALAEWWSQSQGQTTLSPPICLPSKSTAFSLYRAATPRRKILINSDYSSILG